MIHHIKNTMIVNFRFILLILLLISCKKHENFDNKRTSVPISQIIEVKKDSIKDEQVFNFFAAHYSAESINNTPGSLCLFQSICVQRKAIRSV